MRYLIVLLLLSFAESAVAQPTCDAVPTINPTTANKYKINFDNIHLVGDGISALEWRYAVYNATEEWNNNANGGWFEYDGTTTLNFIPQKNCTPQQKINLVRIAQTCSGSNWGLHQMRCDNQNWMVTHCASNAGGSIPWTVGNVTSTSQDVHANLAHEFGHALGLDHASGTQQGVMRSGNERIRALYPWDIECHEREYGRRSRPIQYRHQPHNSDWTSLLYTMATGYARGMGNVRYAGPGGTGAAWASVAYNNAFRNSMTATLNTYTSFNQRYVGGFSNTWIPELPTRWRTHYNYDYDSANRYTNALSRNNVWQYAYSHDFNPSDLTQGRLQHCTGQSTCNPANVYTYQPISTAFDRYSNRTLFAWVNQTRDYGTEDRRIKIAVGNRGSNERLLNVPFNVPTTATFNDDQSATNVALTCGKPYSADGYDCIIVFSALNQADYRLWARRFYVSGSTDTTYDLVWDPVGTSVGWLAGSNSAAWHNNNGWWIAHTSGTGIQVRRSLDTINWTHSTTLQSSIGPPQVATLAEPTALHTSLYFTAR